MALGDALMKIKKKSARPQAGDSLWAKVKPPSHRAVQSDVEADACVIGAGIAGMTTAYLLALEGKRVVVVDDGPVGGGQTQVTTAHLGSAIDDRYVEIERLHGSDGARLAAESHATAIDRIEAIAQREQIDCDFERVEGYLFAPPGESSDLLDEEFEAARRAGLKMRRASRAPWRQFDTGACLVFERQGQFHPLKYLVGLDKALRAHGGVIYGKTHAKSVEADDRVRVTTAGGPTVTADNVVVATNTPINDMYAIHTKQAPYISYVVGIRVPAGLVPRALYWDTADPYHYVRVQPLDDDDEHELLIVGGEDHKTGQADDGPERFTRLEQWARERFGVLHDAEYRWSGQVMETLDGLAFIGHNPMDKPNVYIATGDSGMGMTHGTIAGILLTDLIVGRENPWSQLYDPSRKPVKALPRFAKENLNVAAQYASWVTPGEVKSPDEIAPSTGAVMRRGLKKVAIYKDANGHCVELSATCPHLQCIVAWNPAESTWDCPCHGSRFSTEGEVLNGPANIDLPRVDDQE
jgi:glycine/D-amino acid oxidase-like deaminating enzyme/nitrite reductase/ring-hydroxylating ferredoxin subunit